MQEVRSRVFCSEEGCQKVLEYWATLEITMRDTSDTFQTSSTPEVTISPPSVNDTGWTTEGSWTHRYYCPTCATIRLEDQRLKEQSQSKRKKKS